MKKIFIILTIFCLLFGSFLSAALAADYYFNPHFIISDEEMSNYQALSLNEIEIFLVQKNSALAHQQFPDYQGNTKTASEIIWQACQESKVNPKLILATLQKEQSLIEDPVPTQNQFDKAMGYRCPDGGVCNPKAYGFGKQVDGAAWQFRQYLDNPGNWNFRAGQVYTIDGFTVVPVNTATAGLYNYTPHYSGNERFWRLWQKYWGVDYLDGSLLKTPDSPAIWLLQYGVRRLITSWGVFVSRFDSRKILTVAKTDLEKYEIGPEIKFYNYSLLRIPTGKIYLLVDDRLRHINSPEVFRTIGFNWEEIIQVTAADLAGYTYGPEITVKSIYPIGTLLQNKKTNEIFYVEDGLKHLIYSQEILKSNFGKKAAVKISPEELSEYSDGDPLKFKDGELIKSDKEPKIYAISDGYRHWVKDEKTFNKFGYKWYNVITTSQQAVDIHPLGQDIE